MFHGAIEIHGVEWSFGWADKGFTGVFDCQPTTNELHRHRETIELGWTWMGSKETRSLIRDLEHEWMGPSYDFLRRNCCHFCDEVRTPASNAAPSRASLCGRAYLLTVVCRACWFSWRRVWRRV